MPQVSANPVRSAAWIMARVRATGRRDLISTIDREYRKGEDLCGPVGSKLSPQQERIARAYVNGRRTQGQIATDLKITGACVNVQLKRIRHKLSAATDQELTEAFRRGYGFGVDQGAPADGELSPREIAVLREQYDGYTRSQIARRLGIKGAAVEQARARARFKLGVTTTTEAVSKAAERGLLRQGSEVAA
jgi:DNA-binding CsgD family transcriptional regulator